MSYTLLSYSLITLTKCKSRNKGWINKLPNPGCKADNLLIYICYREDLDKNTTVNKYN